MWDIIKFIIFLFFVMVVFNLTCNKEEIDLILKPTSSFPNGGTVKEVVIEPEEEEVFIEKRSSNSCGNATVDELILNLINSLEGKEFINCYNIHYSVEVNVLDREDFVVYVEICENDCILKEVYVEESRLSFLFAGAIYDYHRGDSMIDSNNDVSERRLKNG